MYPEQTDFFLNQYEEAVKRPFGIYLLISELPHKITVHYEQTSYPVKKSLTKQGFKTQELLKYLKQQHFSLVPLLPAVQELQGNMDKVLSRKDLLDDEKV